MTFWKTLKEMFFGKPLREQFQEIMENDGTEPSTEPLLLTELADTKTEEPTTVSGPSEKRVRKKVKSDADQEVERVVTKIRKPRSKKT